jgi:hypothetical protein
VVRFQLAIPAAAATNLVAAATRIRRGGLAGIGEIAVAEQNPKLYILDRHNEI